MNKEKLLKIMEDNSWVIEINKNQEFTCEYGANSLFSVAETTLINNEGCEMQIPQCDKCNNFKMILIAKDCFKWVCANCEDQ